MWLAALALTAAACAADWPALALALFLAAGWALGETIGKRPLRRRPLVLAGLAVTAALTAAIANETAYRAALRLDLAGPRLAALAAPTPEETAADREALGAYFDRFDLADLAAADLADLDRSDLAFQLWRESPLARGRAVSAVELRGYDGESYLFSFGIPLDSRGRPQVQSRERIFDRPVWDYTLVNEGAPVLLDQRPWGEVEYWLLVRPGHRLAAPYLSDVSLDLLHGGPSGRGEVQNLVRPAAYAFYSNAQQARISPWMEPPTLPEEALPSRDRRAWERPRHDAGRPVLAVDGGRAGGDASPLLAALGACGVLRARRTPDARQSLAARRPALDGLPAAPVAAPVQERGSRSSGARTRGAWCSSSPSSCWRPSWSSTCSS